ncbi:hypothetical protein [Priestia aryabhattai]|uniref:Uncharacterized protein n=1 Tax=Priestia aryabhattai TaxID=412384 RepID=A0ABD7X436_PRIAR|nr:hypothetical protein [Priestia aryabhattai]WEA47273.1 hypothetical protein PWO00_28560 [Priestia aryabhattai]
MGTMRNELAKWKRATGYKEESPKKTKSPPKKKKQKPVPAVKETFSRREIEEMMGIRTPRFERRRGALRQK